jgi:hypothetical protein
MQKCRVGTIYLLYNAYYTVLYNTSTMHPQSPSQVSSSYHHAQGQAMPLSYKYVLNLTVIQIMQCVILTSIRNVLVTSYLDIYS